MGGHRYLAPPPGHVRLVPLDWMTAVYHRASGQTHVVAAPVPEILEVMGEVPLTTAELLAQLAERFTLPDADEAALADRLEELAAIGLVERL